MSRMSTALSHLSNYARAHADDADEIRAYVHREAGELSAHLGPAFVSSVVVVDADRLPRWIAAECSKASMEGAAMRAVERLAAAQASADLLVSFARREADRIVLDMKSVLHSCLTAPRDILVFHDGGRLFETFAVEQAPLHRIAKVARDRGDFVGWVSAKGIHLRSKEGRAGYNLHRQVFVENAEAAVAFALAGVS